MTYRIVMLDFAVRDSCAMAARAESYTEALEIAQNAFKTDLGRFTGVKATETMFVVIKPLNGDRIIEEPNGIVLGGIDTVNNVYLLKAIAKAEVSPLFTMGSSWMGLKIPGLTCAFPLIVSAQSYVEDPDILTK